MIMVAFIGKQITVFSNFEHLKLLIIGFKRKANKFITYDNFPGISAET